jgi:hypothetical protein
MMEGLAGLTEQPTDKSSDGDLSTCNALEVEDTGNVTPLPADGAHRDKTRSSMSQEAASKRQRLLWIAGIVTILVLAGVVATMQPGNEPPFQALNHSSETFGIFCAIADVPYLDSDIPALPVQIATQMESCEFLVHLGDIMEGYTPCTEDRYILVKNILLASPIPTFIVPGDNEVRVYHRSIS